MDNLTHSLIGISAGECFRSKVKTQLSQPLILTTSIVANNFPDLDMLLGRLNGPFSYILQHRGFTHTFLCAIPQTFLILMFIFLFTKSRNLKFSGRDWLLLTVISLGGIFLHIIADSCNSYGVHPFWPFNNKWYYGDSIFIAEPWLWLTLAISFYFVFQNKMTKIFFGAISALAIFLPLITHVASFLAIFILIIWTVFLIYLFRKISLPERPLASFSTFLMVVILFLMGARYIKGGIKDVAWQFSPEAHLYDLIVTPMPINFLCWNVILVETHGTPSEYRLTNGFYSPIPLTLSPETCARKTSFMDGEELKFQPKKPNQDLRIAWAQSYKTPAENIRKLYDQDCRVRAFFQFARAPYVQVKGGNIIMGDFRFERAQKQNFTRLMFRQNDIECPRHLPPWIAPRSDFILSKE
jgi:inner membrane protein